MDQGTQQNPLKRAREDANDEVGPQSNIIAIPDPALAANREDPIDSSNQAQPMDQDNAALPNNNEQPPNTQPGNSGQQPPVVPSAAAAPTATAPPPPPTLPAPDTYLSRELRHIERENAGELSVVYATNDNTPTNMKLLIGLKNVFSKCLPNMPKTYIIKLLFDRRHKSVVIVRNDGTVIGGIAYRPFYAQRFAEIAFCAIAQSLQVSGFGTRLMNWTKHYARTKDGCEYFLTYADNNAVGYFSKQGFTKQITMPKDRWHGYIKDYDGGTLMECYIHPTLPFTTLPEMITVHKQAVEKAVQRYSKGHIIRPGLDWWTSEGGNSGGPMPIEDIPGVKESGWSSAGLAAARPKYKITLNGKLVEPNLENIHVLMEQMLDKLNAQEALVWPFREPVNPLDVPDYHTIIKDPIALSDIRKKVDSKKFYITLEIFTADVLRMFKNAETYNSPDTEYYRAAKKLSSLFQNAMNNAVIYD